MNSRFSAISVAVLIGCLALAGRDSIAQQGPAPDSDTVHDNPFQDDPGQQGETLPGIEVRPQPESDLPATAPPSGDFQPTDPTLSYPNLSDLQFGQPDGFDATTGILRGPGSIFDTDRAAAIVTRETIEEKQAADMFQTIQNEVGVLIQSTAAGQASPFIRGLTGQQILLLVDGIRMNNGVYRFGPNQYFNTIDPGMVDHIEVLRGSGSVLWGSDAIGGVINVVSRGPDVDQGWCCGNYWDTEFTQYYNTSNSSPYSRWNVEGWADSAGVFSGGSFLNVRDLDTGFDDFPRQPGTNYQQYAGDVKLNYLLDEWQMLTVALQHLEQEDVPRSDRFPGYPGDRDGSNSASGARFFDPQQRDLAYLRYQSLYLNDWMDALTVTASYNRQREILTRGIPTTTQFQETDVETAGLSLVTAKEFDRFGRFTLGADWYYDDVDSPFGGAASGPIIPDDAYYERFGVFANWDVPLTCCLDLVAGVRYESVAAAGTPEIDVIGASTPIFISPSFSDWVFHVGAVYELSSDLNLVASVSEGFRAPNLDELMGNNPNVLQNGMDLPSLDLTPEHALNYEVGVKADYEFVRFQTFVFWTDLMDNIVPISVGPDEFARANQDSYIQGVEFNGEYLLDCGWSVYGNFWYTYGKNLVTDAPLSRIPPTQGILGVRWRDAELRGYFDVYTWMSARQDRLDPVRDLDDERIPLGGTPGFATLNLRAGKTFGRWEQHRLSLSLENITDKNYLVHGSGVFGTGLTARFGYAFLY